MKQVREFIRKIFVSLPSIIQHRLLLALLAANISALTRELQEKNKVITKLKQDDLMSLIEHCEKNYPECKDIIIEAAKTGSAALFAFVDQLPEDEKIQVSEVLNGIPEQTRLQIVAYVEKSHRTFVTENKKLSYHFLSKQWNTTKYWNAKSLLSLNNPNLSLQSRAINGNTVVVMTDIYGGFGDFFAAKRLIAAIKAHSPTLRVIWLINRRNNLIPQETLPGDENHVFLCRDELFQSPQIESIYSAAFAFEYPVGYQVVDQRFDKINRLRQQIGLRSVFHVFEYDCVNSFAKEVSLHTGFSRKALGIFLGEPLSINDDSLTKKFQSHPGTAQLFAGKNLQQYRQTHTCYLGYRNAEAYFITNGVDASCFILAVISLQKRRNNNKNIDIITPFSESEVELISRTKLEFLRKNKVAKICFIKGEEVREINIPNSDPQGVIVRAFNFFPFPNDLFNALINFVERNLIMCTGDLSLSGVLEVPGAIPLYQIMGWKEELYKQFCRLAREVCGDCELTDFLHSLYRPLETEDDDFPEWIASFIVVHGDRMQQQMLQLQQYLREKKNLFNTLPALIVAMMKEHNNTCEPNLPKIVTLDDYVTSLGLRK